jgi:endonuclease G
MSNISKSTKVSIILILIGFIITIGCGAPQTDSPENNTENPSTEVENPSTEIENLSIEIENPSIEIENPSIEKVEIPSNILERQEQIINHIGYTVSYNSEWKIPNWVAYELTKEEVDGVIPRKDAFASDPEVPSGKSATTNDYKNSGWDRGHMAPAADMKWSEQAMKESFYFSNICPQNKNLNSGIWKDLEEQVRTLATQKGKLYVVCGPVVSKEPKTIGENKVAIPDAFFKVLLQNDDGEWAAIAFMFANESGRKLLSTYAMSVEKIQTITDIDFFPALPDSIEKKIERQIDFTKWNINSNK